MNSTVYMGRLDYECRESDIKRFFKGYGRIRNIMLKIGYGFVEFEDYRDAEDVVYELNGKELLGERVILEIARGDAHRNYRYPARRRGNWMNKYGPPTRTDYRVIVENLSSRVSWQDLKDFMRQAGDVTYAEAHKHRRNEGLVEFSNYSDMKNSIYQLDRSELNGQKIRIYEERSHRNRGHRSRSKSSSRSSRSRSRVLQSRSKSKSKGKSGSNSPSRSETVVVQPDATHELQTTSQTEEKSSVETGGDIGLQLSEPEPLSGNTSKDKESDNTEEHTCEIESKDMSPKNQDNFSDGQN